MNRREICVGDADRRPDAVVDLPPKATTTTRERPIAKAARRRTGSPTLRTRAGARGREARLLQSRPCRQSAGPRSRSEQHARGPAWLIRWRDQCVRLRATQLVRPRRHDPVGRLPRCGSEPLKSCRDLEQPGLSPPVPCTRHRRRPNDVPLRAARKPAQNRWKRGGEQHHDHENPEYEARAVAAVALHGSSTRFVASVRRDLA